MTRTAALACITAICLALASPSLAQDGGTSIDTRVGTLTFDAHGFPTAETSELLFSWMDFNYAIQSYLWGLPYVGMQGWYESNRHHGATGPTDMVAYRGYEGSGGVLTPTSNVTYVFAFPNLAATGPMVWDIPPGDIVGSVMDFTQRAQGDFGLPGPDKGEGVKLLLVGPEQEEPADAGDYRVIHIPTNTVSLGLRIINPQDVEDLSSKLKLYPWEQRENPPQSRMLFAAGEPFYMAQPKEMAYWERLNEVIQREPVAERDRFYMDLLRHLGIEKGKPFEPTERQAEILLQAARVGDKMALSNAFERVLREDVARYRDDSHWKYVVSPELPRQHTEYYDTLEERAAYTYEAIATSDAMASTTPGIGSAYLGAYRDADGEWLDGSRTYRLHVPANPPAKQFWSATVYDNETRAFVRNETKVAEVGSRTEGLISNDDGSVDVYFGPKAPEGKEANWVQTDPTKGWFTYFRLYGPLEGYFDATWPLPDIEKVVE